MNARAAINADAIKALDLILITVFPQGIHRLGL